ncbi:MAG: aminopeptidase P family protein [Methylocapsa sp.]|nr:aminopeptidase P family protein [Methylocapsa sp.]
MFDSLYQSFEDHADPSKGAEKVAALRAEFGRLGIGGLLIPRADEHQNEFVAPCEERLAWLTGFTGSAGLAIVLKERAAIFVDGRYAIAVQYQVDSSIFAIAALSETSPQQWLKDNLAPGARLGYDPWLHTPGQVGRLAKALQSTGIELAEVEPNPIDAIWHERPPPPAGAIHVHGRKFAGETAKHKIARIVSALGESSGLLVSDPHSVAWLFNIRGHDIAHTPVPLSYALILKDRRPRLYASAQKFGAVARRSLASLANIEEPECLARDLKALGAENKKLLFDSATVPCKLTGVFKQAGGICELGADPIAARKACKNRAELEGARNAHLRDGAALACFLHWFAGHAPGGKLSEIDAALALEVFRRDTKRLKDISFPTISAAGANAAIPHYHVTAGSNAKIGKGIFLIDSGGQYEDGTTDVTRTIAVGTPAAIMRDRFTRVLKGHIAIARAVFPKGTTGAQIDALARVSLWQAGLDFDHGTGHGVGSYLSVHEGPQRIAKSGSAASLEPGMIVSNEPGYYLAGHWGIRIENLLAVEQRKIAGEERATLGFETLTLAPIDRTLIEPRLLDAGEIGWINAYHTRVRQTISPLVEPRVRRWLRAATEPLSRPDEKARAKTRKARA